MKKTVNIVICTLSALLLTACFGGKLASSAGGEVTGVSGHAFSEPTPYGMTLIKRGHLKMGID
ncbi:MAG: gliding motility-associated lipoprotein GldK, partial [Prevotella sp.]|nr:gliding motility-associated lipoprotein GldK [Prevotella sp.]